MAKIRHYFFNLKTSFRRIFATWRLPQKSSMTHTKGFSWKKKMAPKSRQILSKQFCEIAIFRQ
jgi:hypothetical protein